MVTMITNYGLRSSANSMSNEKLPLRLCNPNK